MSVDLRALRAEFPIFAEPPEGAPLHYLDSAATGQMPRAVLEAVQRFETRARANVHRGVHRLAEAATSAYEGARESIARYLGVPAKEIVFTSGATGAINIVAQAFGGLLAPGDEVAISELEHHSNIVPWQMLRDRCGIVLRVIPATEDGRIDPQALETAITKRCRLVAVTHASNVTGALTDVGAVVGAARAAGARVLLDSAQRAPHGPFDLPTLGVDFCALSGHKMFAPHGVGVLWARRDLLEEMPPVFGGGEMIRTVTFERTTYAAPPQKFEAGTPPIGPAIGLGAAAEWLMTLDWSAIAAHELRLTQRILDGLPARVRVLGPSSLQGRIGVVSMAHPGAHPHDVCQVLDRRGVAVRGGHHCAQPLMERFDVTGTTRASLALYNDDGDVDALLAGLDEALALLA